MRTHRIHTSEELEPGILLTLQDRSAHYLARVLRANIGQTVVLFNGDGHDYVSEIVDVTSKSVSLRVDTRLPACPEPALQVTMVQAISRGERFDATLQKCTELGAVAFQPLITARTEVRIRPDKLERRMQHWRSIIVSACEQCGRAILPGLAVPMTLNDWIAQADDIDRFILDPTSPAPLARAVLGKKLQLLVGPEGGFTDAELAQLVNAGARAVSLGPRILRTETAGPAAMAALQALAGDFA